MTEHVVPKKTYFLIFSALIALTLTTVRVATIDLGPLNTIVALVIAACKATLVILFFMHVRYSRKLIWLVVASGVMWLALLIGLTLADFVSRPWLPSPRGW
jgi:cytochrome c oxidase subunit IV